MRICFRCFLPLTISLLVTANPCAAGETMTAHLETLKSSPACTTTPPEGINPDFYLWPKSDIDPYHGNPDTYSGRKMFYCRGDTTETDNIIYVWPFWPFAAREDWYYPIEVIDTVAGALVKRGREAPVRKIFLGGNVFMEIDSARFLQAYSFDQKKTEIIVAVMEKPGRFFETQVVPVVLLDVGVSPPFISDYLYIGAYAPDNEGRIAISSIYGAISPQNEDIEIEKISENKFLISGWSLRTEGSEIPTQEHFVYDRKMRSIIKAK